MWSSEQIKKMEVSLKSCAYLLQSCISVCASAFTIKMPRCVLSTKRCFKDFRPGSFLWSGLLISPCPSGVAHTLREELPRPHQRALPCIAWCSPLRWRAAQAPHITRPILFHTRFISLLFWRYDRTSILWVPLVRASITPLFSRYFLNSCFFDSGV